MGVVRECAPEAVGWLRGFGEGPRIACQTGRAGGAGAAGGESYAHRAGAVWRGRTVLMQLKVQGRCR